MPGRTPAPYPGKDPRKKDEDELVNSQVGTYIITKLIASGGMGKVYEGYKNPWAEIREKYASSQLGKDFLTTILKAASANKKTARFAREEDRLNAHLEGLAEKFLKQTPEERESSYQLLRDTLDSGELEGAKRAIKVVKKELLSEDVDGFVGMTLKPEEPEVVVPEDESDWYGETLTDRADEPSPAKKDSASTSKVLDRFVREITIAKRLKHPHIVQGVETGTTDDGTMFIAMEYVENAVDLTREPLTAEEAMTIGRQVNSALQYAHQEGIVHRDVKPDNILARRTRTGLEAKLTDFGIASMAEQKAKNLTQTQELLGTPNFLAPEMARSEPTTEKSDVYSLGGTLYYLLTGVPPIAEKTDIAQIIYFLTQDSDPKWVREYASDVSEDAEDAVMMMLAKEQDERLSTQGAELVLEELFEEGAFRKSVKSDDERERELKALRKQVSGFGWKKKGVEAAEIYEKIGKMLPRDVAGARERMQAFSKAREWYERADDSLQARVEVLDSRIALERRRLRKLGATENLPERPKWGRRLVKTAIGLGIVGVLAYTGVEIAQDQMLKSSVDKAYESAVTAIEQDDFSTANERLTEAMQLAEDLPKSSERVKNIEALVVRLENERNHYRAEQSFEESRAVLRTNDEDKYERASELLSQAQSFAEQLPASYREFKTNLSQFTVQIDNHRYIDQASRLYEPVTGWLAEEEFLFVANQLVKVEEVVEKVADARGSAKEKLDALAVRIEQAEEALGPHEPYIEIYRGLERTVESVSGDAEKFEQKLAENEFFERSALASLEESASRASSLLKDTITVKPASIGSPLEALQERAETLVEERLPALLEEYDTQQTAYIASRLDAIDTLLAQSQDYTGDIGSSLGMIADKLSEAKERLEQVSSEPLSERVETVEASYGEIKSDYDAFVAWAEQGDEGRVKRARAYLFFDHVQSAESELEQVAEADTSVEREIIQYARAIQDEETYVQRTPSGLTAEMVSAYADTVTWCREQEDYSNIKDMLSALGARGVDVAEAQDSVRRIRELRASLPSLEGDALVDAKRRLSGHDENLDKVKQAADSLVQERAELLPPLNTVRRLAGLYRQIEFSDKADALLGRYGPR